MVAIALSEVGMGCEAGRQGNIQDRRIGVPKQLARSFQAYGHVIPTRGAAQVAQEEALNLAQGEANPAGDLERRQWVFQVF